MNLFDLTGRKALITGSSRGLGRAMAEAMLEARADVALLGSSPRVLSSAKELGNKIGRNVVPIQADLSHRDQLHRAFDECIEKLGALDILIVSHGAIMKTILAHYACLTLDQLHHLPTLPNCAHCVIRVENGQRTVEQIASEPFSETPWAQLPTRQAASNVAVNHAARS